MFRSNSISIFVVSFCYFNLIAVETVYLPILLDKSLSISAPHSSVPVLTSLIHKTLSAIDDTEKVKFFCVKPQSTEFRRVYVNETKSAVSQKIVLTKPIALLVHGWTDKFDSIFLRVHGKGWMIRTSHDWAKYGDRNVCAVDWHALAANFYSVAAHRTKYVGRVVGKLLLRMIEFGMPLDRITVAGHSMGAHIAGFAGSYLKKRNLYLNEIYALDPAGALFTYPTLLDKSERVDDGDAKYVQAIHTSIVLGSGVEAGHADFYIDGGVSQPGCTTKFLSQGLLEIPTICNHFRAVELFQLSLNPQNTERIVGVGQSRNCALTSKKRLKSGYCEPTAETMGIHNRRRRGRFDLSTVHRTINDIL